MTASYSLGDGWRTDERSLREREIKAYEATAKSQRKSSVVQTIAVLIAAVAAGTAGWGTYQAAKAAHVTQQDSANQAINDQFVAAVSAIGDPSAAAQVAGLTLLQRNVTYQVQLATKGSADRQEAYDAYASSLDVFGEYLHGITNVDNSPISADYAAKEINVLMGVSRQVKAIGGGQRPAIDLAAVNLTGVSWPSINFGWLTAYMPHINLSDANLQNADLRCADLQGADLRGADLEGADLTGANLQGARLPTSASAGHFENGAGHCPPS